MHRFYTNTLTHCTKTNLHTCLLSTQIYTHTPNTHTPTLHKSKHTYKYTHRNTLICTHSTQIHTLNSLSVIHTHKQTYLNTNIPTQTNVHFHNNIHTHRHTITQSIPPCSWLCGCRSSLPRSLMS